MGLSTADVQSEVQKEKDSGLHSKTDGMLSRDGWTVRQLDRGWQEQRGPTAIRVPAPILTQPLTQTARVSEQALFGLVHACVCVCV